MENCSIHNSIMISSCSTCEKTGDHDDHSFEESGWTTYFEDFFANNNSIKDDDDEHLQQHTSFYHDDAGTTCPIDLSDAASLAVNYNKSTSYYSHDQDHDHEHEHAVVGLPSESRRDDNKYNSRSLSLKKRRTKEALVDDALEDTASSAVSSPKFKIKEHQTEREDGHYTGHGSGS